MSRTFKDDLMWFIADHFYACIFVVLILISAICYPSYAGIKEVTVTVTNKEPVPDGSGFKYIIYSENESYEISDSYVHWRFDGADLYKKIEVGQTYRLKVYGYRVGFFSAFRNILEIEQV